MPSRSVIDDFLAQHRLAFVGVSHEPKEFSASVYRSLRERGYELLPVNPHAETIEGDPCFASVADLPDDVDGAIVMVRPPQPHARHEAGHDPPRPHLLGPVARNAPTRFSRSAAGLDTSTA